NSTAINRIARLLGDDIISSIYNNKGEGLKVMLFPNPTNNISSMVFSENHNYSKATITDVSGRVVQIYELSTNKTQESINTASLSNGIYFIQLTGSKHNLTLKLIKQ